MEQKQMPKSIKMSDDADGRVDHMPNLKPINELIISSSENNASNWKEWWENFEIYSLATGLIDSSECRKIAVMLHSIGSKGRQIFNSFNMKISDTTLNDVKIKFDNYFEPQKNLTMLRHTFFTRTQKVNESIDNFITDLENLSMKCEFKDLRESLVRDIFIANMNSHLTNIRQRLLQEVDISLQKAVELAKSVVLAQQNSEKIQKESIGGSEQVLFINKKNSNSYEKSRQSRSQSISKSSSGYRREFQNRRSSPSSNSVCGRCGQQHRYKCPASNVKCRMYFKA
ncbi:uncharacterized protein LOC123315805 [Coccinella septempunctata]|uniref:uncharacterized protein LOC123315805 n=1 Tax=Coccinella septempunctata TaxID=41139 RepID=UPI001D07885E|nr:uncharacterized protein LOC123315805 [Coccinella septempunctata]